MIQWSSGFHSVGFSDWTGISLFMRESVAVNLNRMLRVTRILLSKIHSARKFLPSGNQTSVVVVKIITIINIKLYVLSDTA